MGQGSISGLHDARPTLSDGTATVLSDNAHFARSALAAARPAGAAAATGAAPATAG